MKKLSRRKFSADLKAKAALEAVKNQQTLAVLAKKFDVNPVMISKWKAELLENMAAAFEKKDAVEKEDVDAQELYAQIGQPAGKGALCASSMRIAAGTLKPAAL